MGASLADRLMQLRQIRHDWDDATAGELCLLEEAAEAIRAKCLETTDIQYLITRLEAVVDLLRRDEKHMAMAKLLADISALKGIINPN